MEAVFYGKPVLVNRYPVYDADIRPLGFRFVEISGEITPATVREVRALLDNPARAARIARHNFELGRQHLSDEVLRRRLGRWIGKLTNTRQPK